MPWHLKSVLKASLSNLSKVLDVNKATWKAEICLEENKQIYFTYVW